MNEKRSIIKKIFFQMLCCKRDPPKPKMKYSLDQIVLDSEISNHDILPDSVDNSNFSSYKANIASPQTKCYKNIQKKSRNSSKSAISGSKNISESFNQNNRSKSNKKENELKEPINNIKIKTKSLSKKETVSAEKDKENIEKIIGIKGTVNASPNFNCEEKDLEHNSKSEIKQIDDNGRQEYTDEIIEQTQSHHSSNKSDEKPISYKLYRNKYISNVGNETQNIQKTSSENNLKNKPIPLIECKPEDKLNKNGKKIEKHSINERSDSNNADTKQLSLLKNYMQKESYSQDTNSESLDSETGVTCEIDFHDTKNFTRSLSKKMMDYLKSKHGYKQDPKK